MTSKETIMSNHYFCLLGNDFNHTDFTHRVVDLMGEPELRDEKKLAFDYGVYVKADPMSVQKLIQNEPIDTAVVPKGAKLTDFDAVFFDMDSTLCQTETLDEIASILGVGEECARITADAMSGKLPDYAASLRARVALLQGKPADCMEKVYAEMKPNLGVEAFLAHAHALGLKTYIVSSGFTYFTERMKTRLKMTATCANRIEVVDGKFTGRVFGPVDDTILDASGKAAFVERTMSELGSTPERAITCGDGSNDVKMISLAGLGVGFRPKPVLAQHANVILNHLGFDALIDLLT